MRVSRLELAQHNDSAGTLVLVQNHQLNSFIRTGLPRLCRAKVTSRRQIAPRYEDREQDRSRAR